ncbi:hypothetical protein ACI2K4_04370 [Micromonospora sp. NPDC050397]|uniref:hypothetical protein n=1 Tax=Micromonospora sp. NPDC050397 TaxID=3364279 RepID=UPI00384E2E6B
MAGTLHALLLRPSDPIRAGVAAVDARLVALAPPSGLAMLPLTDEVQQRITGDVRTDDPVPGFYDLSRGLADWARSLSYDGPVGYVHLEFHGGTGFHAAVGWRDGTIAWGPEFTANASYEAEAHYRFLPPGQGGDMAINGLLRWLGVDRADHLDEFEAVDLVRHRSTERWAADPTT